MNTTTRPATDSLKSLAVRFYMTVSEIRALAENVGLDVRYSPSRRTWFINESAATVSNFNNDLKAF